MLTVLIKSLLNFSYFFCKHCKLVLMDKGRGPGAFLTHNCSIANKKMSKNTNFVHLIQLYGRFQAISRYQIYVFSPCWDPQMRSIKRQRRHSRRKYVAPRAFNRESPTFQRRKDTVEKSQSQRYQMHFVAPRAFKRQKAHSGEK